MTTLTDEDEAALLGLSRHAGADNVRQVLKEIAGRHGADWRTWPDWSCGLARAQTPLSMAMTKLDSDSYLPIIEFAFGPFCRRLHDVGDVRSLFKSFFDVIGMLMGFHAAPGGDAAYAGRIKACFAAFLAAAGGGRPLPSVRQLDGRLPGRREQLAGRRMAGGSVGRRP